MEPIANVTNDMLFKIFKHVKGHVMKAALTSKALKKLH